MGAAALILSIFGAIVALVGIIPWLHILNWFAGGFLVLAIILGIISAVVSEKKGTAIAGTAISVVFLIVVILRLALGIGISRL
jgi:hypothetical protein